ncbi:hypothetical protein P154DRAFT_433459 [Amniculicola lignicola CBS 123094]|uniref:DUF3669 domain-containing protein n=1 Tax=Amniculicola lignicola CBS 123094 TaxID=1392246 RepID=A0A6A5WH32_9PLEO|nr:hypothetical protein P154DRAFT_433459 [Amniculicola lignicola CBS 123094]
MLSEKIRFAHSAEEQLGEDLSVGEEVPFSDGHYATATHPSPEVSIGDVQDALIRPVEVLKRTFSIHSVVSTSSRFADRMMKATLNSEVHLNVIGRGTCGTVFEVPGQEIAFKKGRDKDALWNDVNFTSMACNAVIETRSSLENLFRNISIPRIPVVQAWVRAEDLGQWWKENKARFPKGDDEEGYIFQVQRILPLAKSSRIAIIQLYFPKDIRDVAMKDPINQACLIRPYLGKRRGEWELDNTPNTLENFPLYLDQLEEIGLDLDQYAVEMGVGLAIIHWKAHLDSMDVEFVIGSRTTRPEFSLLAPENSKPFSVPPGNFKRRQTHLWILDFDKCKRLDINKWEDTRRQMVTAVTCNDPYFPDPAATGLLEKRIWKCFEGAYVKTAIFLLKIQLMRKHQNVVHEFLEDWKKRAAEKLQYADGSFIEFGY